LPGCGEPSRSGILTLPVLLADGKPFPARDLAIFLAAAAIVLPGRGLVVACVGLPVLLKGLEFPPAPSYEAEEDHARVASAEAAIRGVEKAQHEMSEGRDDADLYADIATRIMEFYRRRIDGRSPTGESGKIDRKAEEIEHKLLIAGLKAARNEIFRLARARKLNGGTMRKLVRELDLLESRYDG
jgi:monovalent cation/hydrogen antiporter